MADALVEAGPVAPAGALETYAPSYEASATVPLLPLLVVFMIPWEDVVNLDAVGTAVRLAGLMLAAWWAARLAWLGHARVPASFHAAAGTYLAWNTLSVVWSGAPERTLVQVATVAQLLAFSYILWDTCATRAAVRWAMQMYVLGACVALGSTVYNYLAGTTYYYERFSATGTNPDDLGVVLALGIPLAAYLTTSLDRSRLARWLKPLDSIYVPAACLGIAMSGTRTALIAALPGLLFALSTLTRVRTWARVALLLVLVCGAAWGLPLVPQASLARLGTTSSEISAGNFNGRVALWRQGLVAWVQHPWVGVGGNMYRSVNTERKVAHNSFVSVLVELGLIGLAIFLALLATVVLAALAQPLWDRRLWLAVLATWLAGAIALTWENRKPTWLVLTLIVVASGVARDEASAPR